HRKGMAALAVSVSRLIERLEELKKKTAEAEDSDAASAAAKPKWDSARAAMEQYWDLNAAVKSRDWTAAEKHIAAMQRGLETLDQATMHGTETCKASSESIGRNRQSRT